MEFQPRGSLHCDYCNQFYCKDHIARSDHQCTISEPTVTSDNQETAVLDRYSINRGDSGGRLIAGAILIVGGGFMSLTGVGAILGVPIALLGFGVMFPRFSIIMVILAVGLVLYYFL